MPLAFPSEGQIDGFRLDSMSNGSYYTNEESEVDSPRLPNIRGGPAIVIDPALLGDVQPRQDALNETWGEPEQAMIPQNSYQSMSLGEPLEQHPYMDPGPFDPRAMMQQSPTDPFYSHNPTIYPPFLVENAQPSGPVLHSAQPHFDPKLASKTLKRKPRRRKKPREELCSFCKGTDQANKQGLEEQMVSCWNCGRSGHPSCLQIENIGDVIRSYDWICMECKTCEICRKKGRENLLLFCDMCDRGWHTYCLEPQLHEPPKGTWACPICAQTPVDASSTVRRSTSEDSSRIEAELNAVAPATSVPPELEDEPPPTPAMDVEVDTPLESSEQQFPAPKPRKSLKLKTSQHHNIALVLDDDPAPAPTPARRPRITVRRGPPSPLTVPRVRLKLSKTRGRKGTGGAYDDDDVDPFEGVLQGADADTSKTSITTEDKTRFEKAKAASEMKAGPVNTLPHPSSVLPGTPGPSNRRIDSADPEMLPQGLRPTRSQANLTHLFLQEAGPSRSATPLDKGKEKATASRAVPPIQSKLRVRSIRFGDHEIDTWYDAPFPEEYASVPDGMLWICEFCLKYMKSRFSASRHRLKCKARHPPGDEIYREDYISVFEVDGRKNKIYCQNLCLLSKLFLDHKSLFYDVEPFLFYVMTETDDVGARFIGYFSKEKRSAKEYNLSCIMTLPVRQRRGWGNFLIDFSYLLSKKEGRVGGPETPLSALGAISYKRYWTLSLMYYLRSCSSDIITLQAISAETSMTPEDVFATLQQNSMITVLDEIPTALVDDPSTARPSPARGRSNRNARASLGPSLARRNVTRNRAQTDEPSTDSSLPIVLPRFYRIHFDRDLVEKHIVSYESRNYVRLEPEKLKWSPFLLMRSRQTGVDIEPPVMESGVLVEFLVKKAEEEEARLAVEVPELEERRRVAEEARARAEAEEAAVEEQRRSESLDGANDLIPKSRPLSVARSTGRSQSLRNPQREPSTRLLRNRQNSPPGSEGEADSLSVRTSRRLRERPAATGTTALWRAELRRRDSDAAGTSSDDDNRSPSSRTRLRMRSTASQTTSSHHADGSADEEDEHQSDTDLSATSRVRRSGRQSLRNGDRFGQAAAVEGSQSPRKRRRIESPPDHESDEDAKPSNPPARKTKSMPLRNSAPMQEDEPTPLKTRLRVRTAPREAEEEKTARRSLRSRGPTNGVNGVSGHASEDHDPSTGEDEDGTEHPPVMEFDSTGSLSSAGPEIVETCLAVTKKPMSTRAATASRRTVNEGLVLGDGEHEQEEIDAEGEEDWD